jgi:hypothetical protein
MASMLLDAIVAVFRGNRDTRSRRWHSAAKDEVSELNKLSCTEHHE